jgi:hypothetical protein
MQLSIKRLACVALALAPLSLGALSQDAEQEQAATVDSQATATKSYFWFRMWPDKMVKYDIETDTIAETVTANHGIAHGSVLSHDKRQIFLTTGRRTKVEVIDVAQAAVVEVHDFAEDGYIIRVDTVKEIPGGKQWYVEIDKVKAEVDHFVVEKSEWLLYDIVAKKVEKRLKELPKAIRRGARISPDGEKWHVFGSDIEIVDPDSLEVEGKVELSKPRYSGMGPLSVRGADFYDDENPDAYRMMYTMRDPVVRNRSLAGIVEIDIKNREVGELIEWGSAPKAWRMRYSKDKTIGVGQVWGGDRRNQADGDDPIVTIANYDLVTGKKLLETRVEVRNGLGLSAISPDAQKLYFSGRGHDLLVLTGDHKYLKTVALGGETDGSFYLLEE